MNRGEARDASPLDCLGLRAAGRSSARVQPLEAMEQAALDAGGVPRRPGPRALDALSLWLRDGKGLGADVKILSKRTPTVRKRCSFEIVPLVAAAAAAWLLCGASADAQMKANRPRQAQASPTRADTSGAPAALAPADTSDRARQGGAGAPAVPPGPEAETYELDGIAAIVNDSVILLSEVQEQAYFQASQQGISLADSAAFARVQSEVLERLIEEKVIVDEARKRGMIVTADDLDTAVSGVVQDMIRAAGSEEAFKQQLEREGLTEEDLRDLYRPQLEAQILASRLVRRELDVDPEVTDEEIEAYYNENQDQFPERPETVRLSHIFVSLLQDSADYVRAKEKAEEIRARVLAGEDFAKLARELSADPSASRGGDIGFFKRGQLDPRFERVVFSLKPGETGPVVQTRHGFHVVQLLELKDDEAHARHILVPVAVSGSAVARARAKIESVKVALDGGADFAELAAEVSEDAETRDRGGDLGYYAVDDLTPDVKKVIAAMKPGEVSDIAEAPDGFHIFLMTEHRPKGRFTLEETKEDIRQFLRRQKMEEAYSKWIEDLKREAYIVVKGA